MSKVYNDCIHGPIELPPLCVKIINTPEFDRLRDIKQLGATYRVYPNAAHNRFEHSIGVCYLAGELVKTLKNRQEDLNITERDVLCVQIAGLCHDLGHGPLSHMYDGKFQKKVRAKDPCIKEWRHEEISVMIFDHLVTENSLGEYFQGNDKNDQKNDHGEIILSEKDKIFIKEQITGKDTKGRPEKRFLYEIVANKRNGMDVDKWDYLARDCHMLGIQNSFDYKRFLKFVRVIEVNEEQQICTRDKQYVDLYDMFYTRKRLHELAYQHRVCNLLEEMLSDALVLADNNDLPFEGTDKTKPYTVSCARNDMKAYLQLTDRVFETIQFSKKDGLEESKNLVLRVKKRNLYPLIAIALIKEKAEKTKEEDIHNGLWKTIDEERVERMHNGQKKMDIDKEDIVLDVMTTDYGSKEEDPVEHYRFYTKADNAVGIKLKRENLPRTLPTIFDSQEIRFYTRKNKKDLEDDKKGLLLKCFKKWCDGNGFTVTPEEGSRSTEN